MPERSILIVGTIPPPIGGVTIHVRRLLDHLTMLGVEHEFADIRKSNLFLTLKQLGKAQTVHLHISSPWFRFFMLALLKTLRKKTIFTFHGNVGRHGKFKNFLDRLSFRMADIPVVLNKESLEQAILLNKASRIIAAFIPPLREENLPPEISENIAEIKRGYPTVYAANASYLQYDTKGREVYQILPLISIFKEARDKALIVSDPSGMYTSYLQENGIDITPNILLIAGEHSFFEVLKQADVFLRITTTDGDSLSVKEALYLNKTVIASNVVGRPRGVILTSLDTNEIREVISEYPVNDKRPYERIDNGISALVELYTTNQAHENIAGNT